MANIKSAKKRIKVTQRQTDVNRARRSRMRTFVKKVVAAAEAGNVSEAKQALTVAQKELDKSAAKGLLHKKTAARRMSRLTARVKKLEQAA